MSGDPARRLLSVLRLKRGAEVCVFDGLGHERLATIGDAARGMVVLTLGTATQPLPELPVPVYICSAFPRGSRGDWLVEKATELGAFAFVALEADRSVMLPGDGRLDRWRRIAIEAAEQSGRAVVPTFVAEVPAGAVGLVADLDAPSTPRRAVAEEVEVETSAVALYVGPEGGWTSAERAAFADGGVRSVSLGPRPLRVETAAVTLLALVADALRAW